MAALACELNTQDTGTGGLLQVQGQHGLHITASVRPHLSYFPFPPTNISLVMWSALCCIRRLLMQGWVITSSLCLCIRVAVLRSHTVHSLESGICSAYFCYSKAFSWFCSLAQLSSCLHSLPFLHSWIFSALLYIWKPPSQVTTTPELPTAFCSPVPSTSSTL